MAVDTPPGEDLTLKSNYSQRICPSCGPLTAEELARHPLMRAAIALAEQDQADG